MDIDNVKYNIYAEAYMENKTHRRATPEELKKHKQEHPQILKEIIANHRKISVLVRRKYGSNAQVMRYDNGN